jgi:hypothetical protein
MPVVALIAVTACAKPPAPPPVAPTRSISESLPAPADLRRELEATVLEGYSQLSLGNVEAYRDQMAADVDVVLIELGPGEVARGRREDLGVGALQLKPCDAVLSRNLDVRLSADGSVGWVFDDVSCRLPDPFAGREAAIPLRLTAVYQRYVDSWVLVQQHASYAVPAGQILRWTRAGEGRRPPRLGGEVVAPDSPSGAVLARLAATIAGAGSWRVGERAIDPAATLLLPGPEDEYRGAAIDGAPTLARMFQARAAALVEARVRLARNERVAWVVGSVEVRGEAEDQPFALWLRVTAVLERGGGDADPWQLVQTHVSAPILPAQLRSRVFGARDAEPPAPPPG